MEIPIIRKNSQPGSVLKTNCIVVEHYPWGGTYRPKMTASLCWQEEVGLNVRLVCREKNPRATYRFHNQPVYEDSCMEFFVNFDPDSSGSGYMNFEMNALGTVLCQIGQGRSDRTYLLEQEIDTLGVRAEREPDYWTLTYTVPLVMIKRYFPNADLRQGSKLRCNFYKCGDETMVPHYGCWTPIDVPEPDFHQPDYFGEIIMSHDAACNKYFLSDN